jgi:hypothetical protein
VNGNSNRLDRRYSMSVAGRFTAQQRGIPRPPGISVRTGRCLASETGACTRGWRCSSVPALPLGRSRRRSGCDSPCSHVSSAMPGRACRSPMPGPPPGYNAGAPARTPAARHTTGSPGAGTPDHGRPPSTHRPQAGTAIRWPRATPPRIPSRGRRNTGVPDPEDMPPAVATTGTTPACCPGPTARCVRRRAARLALKLVRD